MLFLVTMAWAYTPLLVEASTTGGAAADLDGDGRVDLIEATAMGPAVRWNEGGRLGPRQLLEGGGGLTFVAEEVAVADVDGDGHLDVCASMGGGVDLHCALLDGTRLLAPMGPFGGIGVQAFELADLDGDGRIDITGCDGRDLEVHLADGLGGFTLFSQGTGRCYDVATADVDGDGDLEVVVGRSEGAVETFDLQGAGLVSLGVQLGDPGCGGDPGQAIHRMVAPLDADGDGDDDVVSCRSAYELFEASGGSLVAPVGRASLAHGASRDLDGDGRVDLFGLLGATLVVPPTGGRAQASLLRTDLREQQGYGWTVPIDLDGDGADELSVATPDGARLLVPDPGGSPTILVQSRGVPYGGVGAALVDVDGDGFDDAVVAYADRIGWRAGRGDGTFGPRKLVQRNDPGASWRSLEALDVDGDGVVDLVATQYVAGVASLWWLPGDGAGFGAPSSVFEGVVSDPVVADLDGDGQASELLFVADGALRTFDGTGVTTLATPAASPGAPLALDLDRDGLVDLVHMVGESLMQHAGLPGGGFAPEVVAYTVPDGVSAAAATDLDGDGALDVLVTTHRTYDLYDGLVGLLATAAGVQEHVPPAELHHDGVVGVVDGVAVVVSGDALRPLDGLTMTLGAPWFEAPPTHRADAFHALSGGDTDADGRTDVLLVGPSETWLLQGDGS